MGWSNYIVVSKLKLIIEVIREVSDLEDYEESAIKKAIDEENIDYNVYLDGDNVVDIGDVPINKITIKDLAELYKRYEIVQSLAGLDFNKLLLFWLKNRDIEFTIKSEHNINMDEFDKEGYLIIRR